MLQVVMVSRLHRWNVSVGVIKRLVLRESRSGFGIWGLGFRFYFWVQDLAQETV